MAIGGSLRVPHELGVCRMNYEHTERLKVWVDCIDVVILLARLLFLWFGWLLFWFSRLRGLSAGLLCLMFPFLLALRYVYVSFFLFAYLSITGLCSVIWFVTLAKWCFLCSKSTSADCCLWYFMQIYCSSRCYTENLIQLCACSTSQGEYDIWLQSKPNVFCIVMNFMFL